MNNCYSCKYNKEMQCTFQDNKRIYDRSLECSYYKQSLSSKVYAFLFPKKNLPPSPNVLNKAPSKPEKTNSVTTDYVLTKENTLPPVVSNIFAPEKENSND